MAKQKMRDLPRGARFIGMDGRTKYEVISPASASSRGDVEVRNLSMTPLEVEQLRATPGAVEPGEDPRDGVFADRQVDAIVEVI